MADEEEWTTVPSANKGERRYAGGRRRGGGNSAKNNNCSRSNRRRPRTTANACSTRAAVASPSFYSHSAIANSNKAPGSNINSNGDALMDPNTKEGIEFVERIRWAIVQCMAALERHEYVINLLAILKDEVPSNNNNNDNNNKRAEEVVQTDEKDEKDANKYYSDTGREGLAATIVSRYGEIVCYGIGNFAPSSFGCHITYSAPMLQLALALVIRRSLVRDTIISSSDITTDAATESDDKNYNNQDFAWQQSIVKMVYFEPLMTDMERVILEDIFHVEIIQTNERGKRCVVLNSPGQQQQQQQQQQGRRSTLFYMPHCPMRLYSNVLWSNWNADILCNGNLVLYGNDFHSYDDRVLSSEERSDPSNGVLRIIPHLESRQIGGLTGTASGGKKKSGEGGTALAIECEELAKIETAFNDSVVMWFIRGNDKEWPERPKEHIFGENNDEGGGGEVL